MPLPSKKIFVLVRSQRADRLQRIQVTDLRAPPRSADGAKAESTTWDYLSLSEREPEEVPRLYEDILIHVTSFFRDPAVFETLNGCLPPDPERQTRRHPFAIWVAGCSTGEEVYSARHHARSSPSPTRSDLPVQIFGSRREREGH